jgi:glycine hydroxymethyltransferase
MGDTIMGMELSSGGHLTHGHRVNFSGRAYRSVSYGVDPATGLLDYNAIERLARRVKPKIIISGLTAYPRIIDFAKFGQIAKKVGAIHMADISHIVGLIATGLHPSPFPLADVVTSTTHKILKGPRGAVIFARKQYAEAIDRAVFPGLQGGPHDNTTAAIAYACREAATPKYRAYAKAVLENADHLARELVQRDLALVTGGTSNHLMIIDVRTAGLEGNTAESLLEQAGIIANRNTIPGDPKPFRPSGIRMGTPAITTRGLRPKDMERVAGWIAEVLFKRKKPETIAREIKSFLLRYPIP